MIDQEYLSEAGRDWLLLTPRAIRWIAQLFLISWLLYAMPSIWLYMNYMQFAFDLGIYEQSLWLITQGEWFNTVGGFHVLGVHFSPILILFSPIALIPGGAVPELMLQATLIASGVVPAWKLAEQFGHDPRWFAVVYAVHPGIVTGAWHGWRPWNLAVPVFMWACYLIVRKPTTLRIVGWGLVLLCFREDLATWVGYLALILLIDGQVKMRTVVRSGLILGSATAVVLLMAIPALSPVEGYYFGSEFESPFADPLAALSSVAARLIFLLLPLAIMPTRLNWRLLLPLAIPVVGLLVRGGPSQSTSYQYEMMFVPLLLVIVGLSTHVEYKGTRLAVASLITLLTFGVLRPIPPQIGVNPWRYDGDRVRELRLVHQDLETIGGSGSLSISAPYFLVPHLSERPNIFIHPFPIGPSEDDEQEARIFNYDCPLPNIVVATPGMLTPEWEDTLSDTYTRHKTSGPIGIWVSDDRIPDKPCGVRQVEDHSTSPQ